MYYSKPPKDIQEQIELLKERGLIIDDNNDKVFNKLEHIGYFRFTGYCKFFQSDNNIFHTGTTFGMILDTYIFDRKLRLLTLDAIEKIEVSFKSILNNFLCKEYGIFWYTNTEIFILKSEFQRKMYNEFLDKIQKLKSKKSVSIFVKAYYEKYTSEDNLPGWMLMEELTLGEITSIYKILHTELREKIANQYGDVYEKDFEIWIDLLGNMRNISAHHGRLWNRKYIIRPRLKDKKLGSLFTIEERQVLPNYYNASLIIHFLLNIINQNFSWIDDLELLFGKFPNIPKKAMGFNDESFDKLRSI